MIYTCLKNLEKDTPKHHFTIGINDDVTHTSLEMHTLEQDITPKGQI